MYGYLSYQQQIIGEIYAKYVPPPTPADLFLNRLSKTSSFSRLKKQGGIIGEFSFCDGRGYLAVERADFILSCGSDYLLLLKTIWIPQEFRNQGILKAMVSELVDAVYDLSPCSMFAVSRPFEFPDGFDPFTQIIPPNLEPEYSNDAEITEGINRVLLNDGFQEVNESALTKAQKWDTGFDFENETSQCFLFWSDKTTWILHSFFRQILART